MDWQLVVTWLAGGVAGGYLLLRARRGWQTSQTGCSGGCGCSKAGSVKEPRALIAPEQLTLRSRPARAADTKS